MAAEETVGQLKPAIIAARPGTSLAIVIESLIMELIITAQLGNIAIARAEAGGGRIVAARERPSPSRARVLRAEMC